MATCKDCIYYEDPCDGFTPSDLDSDVFDYFRKGIPEEIPDIDKRCGSFKNKADVVEVVRCKACKSFVENKEARVTYCRRELKNLTVKPNDFCSYGGRRCE